MEQRLRAENNFIRESDVSGNTFLNQLTSFGSLFKLPTLV